MNYLRRHLLLLATLTSATLAPRVAVACAVCYGDPESDMTRGAVWGVVVLGVIVYGVLFGFVGVGFSWYLRAKKLAMDSGTNLHN